MTKRLGWIALALLIAALPLWAGGQQESAEMSDSDQIELTFMHRWTQDPDNQFFEDIVADYEEQNPNVDIEVVTISNDPFKEKIKIVLGTEEAPDVFFTWPGEFTNRFIRSGNVLDLTPYMEAGWQDTFVQSVLEPFRYEGAIYGSPYRLDAKVFVYNKELFQEAGIRSTPSSFQEFLQLAEELQDAGITPIAFGNQGPWAVSHYIGQLNAYCVPPEVYANDLIPSEGTFDHEGYVTALEKYEDLTPYFNESPNAISHDQARASFINGDAAMMYIEIIEIPEISRQIESGFSERFDVFKMPPIEGAAGNQNHLLGYPEGFVVSANTDYPDEAVDFLKYITGKEAGQYEAQQLGFVNGVKNVVSRNDVSDAIYSTVGLVFETEKMVNWFDSSLHSEIWSVAREELQKLTDNVTSPEDDMAEIREAADDVRAQF